jgi:hypothetical protein
MNIERPEYVGSIDENGYYSFNVEWYKNSINNTSLTLATAKNILFN